MDTKTNKIVIGILSGTSCDGIDVGICQISHEKRKDKKNLKETDMISKAPLEFVFSNNLLYFNTIPYPNEVRKQILHLIEGNPTTMKEVCILHSKIGELFGKAINICLRESNIPKERVCCIGSHGQTIWHQVSNDDTSSSTRSSTLQLGDGCVISALTGIEVICDFRVADVAYGGQGAPLTSIQDLLMTNPSSLISLSSSSSSSSSSSPSLNNIVYWKAIQNIGGMGNVSFISSNRDIICFDTGPGNILSDLAIQHFTKQKKKFDEDGIRAKEGTINEDLLNEILKLDYFSKPPPKTTGREVFSKSFLLRMIEKGKKEFGIENENDFISTLLQVTVESIFLSYWNFGPKEHTERKNELVSIQVNGGGAKNNELLERIEKRFERGYKRKIPIQTLSDEESDAKESKLFALLAYLNKNNFYGNVTSVTGARKSCILGKISKCGI